MVSSGGQLECMAVIGCICVKEIWGQRNSYRCLVRSSRVMQGVQDVKFYDCVLLDTSCVVLVRDRGVDVVLIWSRPVERRNMSMSK